MLVIIFIAGTLFINSTNVSGNLERIEDSGDKKDPSQLELILENSAEDEELHDDIVVFLNDWSEPEWDDNAYVYLWGIDKRVDDVYQTGLNIAKNLRHLNLNHDYKSDYDLSILEKYKELELPEKNYLCRMDLAGCFKDLVLNNAVYLEINEKYQKHTELTADVYICLATNGAFQ